MVKINKITPQTVDVYTPDNVLLGNVNEYEFNDILVQIKTEQISGYYAMFNGCRIRIDRYGTLEDYPNGFFDMISNYLLKLLID